MLGIYIHIPFCKSKCGYCDFCSTSNFDDKLLDSYMKTLLMQFDEFFEGSPKKVDTIYIGGGTPSVFGGKRVAKILKELSKKIELSPNAEITVEANPESCDKGFLKELKKAGVNRLSLGVQSSNDDILKDIGRLHTFYQAKKAVELCKKYLTDNISLDLIYGLPNQSIDDFKHSIMDICGLEPMHISVYGLKLEEGSKMYGQNLNLADDDLQADMYLMAVDLLERRGYKQYEISNFAKGGMVSRHNSKYWDLTEYLGLGAGAHSLYGGKRFAYKGDILEYAKGNIELSEIEDMSIPKKHRKGEYMMLMLRTVKGLDEHKFFDIFGEDLEQIKDKMKKYIENGYAIYDDLGYHLTPKGFLISNTIISDLLE